MRPMVLAQKRLRDLTSGNGLIAPFAPNWVCEDAGPSRTILRFCTLMGTALGTQRS